MSIYLYVKTHRLTGLKYLGQTKQNPFTYKGSGKLWINHFKKHGYDVHTEVIGIFDSKKELKEAGLFYSHIWNIVKSPEWANLKPEEGDGGSGLSYEGMHDHLKRIAPLGGRAYALKENRVAWNKGKHTTRTPESIIKQIATITGRKRGPYKTNGNNPKATKIEFRGKEYPSISHAMEDTGSSFRTIKKYSTTLQRTS